MCFPHAKDRLELGNKSEEFTYLQELVEALKKKKKRMSWERSQILPRVKQRCINLYSFIFTFCRMSHSSLTCLVPKSW